MTLSDGSQLTGRVARSVQAYCGWWSPTAGPASTRFAKYLVMLSRKHWAGEPPPNRPRARTCRRASEDRQMMPEAQRPGKMPEGRSAATAGNDAGTQERATSNWQVSPERRPKREHRHGGAARHRGRPGDHGRRRPRHHRDAPCSPRTGTPRGTRPTPGSRSTARPARSRSWHRRPTTTATSIREWDDTPEDFGRIAADHRPAGHPAAAARRRERADLRRLRRPRGRPGHRASSSGRHGNARGEWCVVGSRA